jgi:hypothetical protein
MIGPYKRIVVMHFTILVGGALVMLLDTPLPALVLLVLLKTAVDSHLHRREHARKQGRSSFDSTPERSGRTD